MDIFVYLETGDLRKINEWLNSGSLIDIKNNDGWTPLMFAVSDTKTNSSLEIVESLLEHGANPNIQQSDGWTPLMFAARYSDYTSSIETVKLLLDYGANPNIKNNNGWTSLAVATYYSTNDSSLETVKLLLDYGADPNIKTDKGKTIIELCHNDECKKLINNKDIEIYIERYGGFNLIKFEGSGGSGKVWKVDKGDKFIALKVIPFEEKNKNIYMKEIDILKDISNPVCHPFLSCVFGYKILKNKIYIEMEYINGVTLSDWSVNFSDVRLHQLLLKIIIDLTDALFFLQTKGIIHGDIKPDNILITPENQPKLVDFGMSCKTDICAMQNYCKGAIGTYFFRAPEVIKYQVVYYSSDIWSLGATIYTTALNKNIYQPKLIEDLHNTRPKKFTSNKKLNIIVKGCLIKEPIKRFGLNDIKSVINSC